MSQVFVSPTNWNRESFSIEGSEAHHLVRVLRRKVGDEIEIFDGAGRRAVGKLTRLLENPSKAEGVVLREQPVQTLWDVDLIRSLLSRLFVQLAKGGLEIRHSQRPRQAA